MKQYLRKIIFIQLIFIFIFALSGIAYSSEDNKKSNTVYLVIANRLSLKDIYKMENLTNIIEDGSIGLMNTRGLSGYTGSEGYATINASSKTYANVSSSSFYNLDDEIIDIIQRRTGEKYEDYEVANIDNYKLLSLNSKNAYNSYIGALGDNLHRSGLKTAVLGNSDTADSFIRTSGLIAMDSRGLIDYGNVDLITEENVDYPFGIKTDYDKILSEVDDLKQDASLIVIETGDLNRLSSYSKNLPYNNYIYHRVKILQDIDSFIGKLFNKIYNDNSMLMIVSPNSPDSRIDSSKLSPLIIWEKTNFKGILTSGTTRRKGIVANLDIAPTITEYLDADTQNFIGQTIFSNDSTNSLAFLDKLNMRINVISKNRSPFLSMYSISVILTLIITVILITFDGINNKKINIVLTFWLLLMLTIPLTFILLSLIKIYTKATLILTFIGITLAILLISYLIKPKYRMFIILVSTLIVLSIDIILGGNLIKYSLLGYDPIIGARYFGIGNEFVGVFLAVMVLSIVYFLDKIKACKIITLFTFGLVILIAHPNLGANVGGTISVFFATLVLLILTFEMNISFKKIMFIIISIAILIVIMGTLDIIINPNPTHLGKTLAMVIENGPDYLFDVILRKLQMNIKLIGNSLWSKVLIICVISLTIVIKFFESTLRKIFDNNRYLCAGLTATLVGSMVGLLVNDSGVLLAAISCIYTVMVLLYELIGIYIDNFKEVA